MQVRRNESCLTPYLCVCEDTNINLSLCFGSVELSSEEVYYPLKKLFLWSIVSNKMTL